MSRTRCRDQGCRHSGQNERLLNTIIGRRTRDIRILNELAAGTVDDQRSRPQMCRCPCSGISGYVQGSDGSVEQRRRINERREPLTSGRFGHQVSTGSDLNSRRRQVGWIDDGCWIGLQDIRGRIGLYTGRTDGTDCSRTQLNRPQIVGVNRFNPHVRSCEVGVRGRGSHIHVHITQGRNVDVGHNDSTFGT